MPTGINVGGVNIAIGVDTTNLIAGVEDAKKSIAGFRTNINSEFKKLNLEGAIKGDPFKSTKNFMKATSKELDNVFASWSTGITKTNTILSKFADKAKANFENVAKDYEKTMLKIARWSKGGAAGAQEGKDLSNIIKQYTNTSQISGTRKRGAGGQFEGGAQFDIAQFFGGSRLGGGGLSQPVQEFLGNLQEGFAKAKASAAGLTPELKKLKMLIDSLSGAKGAQTMFGYAEGKGFIKDTARALPKMGIGIEADKQKKIDAAYLAHQDVEAKGQESQKRLDYATEVVESKNIVRAYNDRIAKVKELALEYNKMTSNIAAGYDVEKSRARALGVLERKRQVQGFLSTGD